MTPTTDGAGNGHASHGPTYIPPEIGSRLARAAARVGELEMLLNGNKVQVSSLEASLQHHQQLLGQTQAELRKIYGSRGWKVLKLYYRLRRWVFPPGSFRRRIAVLLMHGIDKLKAVVKRKTAPTEPSETPAADRMCPAPTRFEPAEVENWSAPAPSTQEPYARWIERNEPKQAELAPQRETSFSYSPRINIFVVLESGPNPYLPALVESVRQQTYANWELCLVGGAGQVPPVGHEMARCRLIPRSATASRADCYHAAFAASTGEYVAVAAPEDTLAPFALFEIVQALNRHEGADLLYSDEDCLSACGTTRTDPHFKPEWSPDTLRGHNYIGALTVVARTLVERIGGFRSGLEGAEQYDLALRAGEQAREIVHIPHVLYHRRGDASGNAAGRAADAAAARALHDHLGRTGSPGHVKAGLRPGTYQVTYALAAPPMISIVIPNKDHVDMLARCLKSIGQSTYRRHEIIVVENGSRQPETFAYYRTLEGRGDVKILRWEKPFNYAAVNNFGASAAAGEILLFLNNDVQVINPDWLERMLEHAVRPPVGAVGAMLYYPDDTIQHAGVVVVKDQGPVHLHRFAPRESSGYCNRLATVQNLSAVTGACLATRRDVFNEVGGFDETFAMLYNDVDLCLKMRQKGYVVVWTPFAQLYHFESVSRGYDGWLGHEGPLFARKWSAVLNADDPYFSPHLKVEGLDCCVNG